MSHAAPLTQSITLSSGHTMPVFGLGTWLSKPNEAKEAVKLALKNGYRHIDCAWIYGNEAEIGDTFDEVFKSGELKREEVFITSKIWCTKHRPAALRAQLLETLEKLRLKYLDLLLIHWPFAFLEGTNTTPFSLDDVPIKDTYLALEECQRAGLVKSIGVSNFNVRQLKDVLTYAEIKPAVNQFESHPYLTQVKLVEFCRAHNIAITAYSPLGNPGSPFRSLEDPDLLADATVKEIASHHKKTASQILIRYHVDSGRVVIPKSVQEERIIANANVFDFKLSVEELSKLNALNRNVRIAKFESAGHAYQYPFNEE